MVKNSLSKVKAEFLQFYHASLSNRNFDNLLNEFAVIAAIVLFLNVYNLSNFSISIDDEVHSLIQSHISWISRGRWTLAIMDRLIFPRPVMPFVPFLFFSLCLAVSYLFLTKAHNIHQKYMCYFTLPIFVSYPLWQFITGFDSTIPGISIGMICVSLAGLLFARTRHISISKKYIPLITSTITQAVLLSVAIGAYQSFLLVFLTIASGIMLINVVDRDETPQVLFYSLAQVFITCILSLLLYYFIDFIARWVTSTGKSAYLDLFFTSHNIKELLRSFTSEIYAYYSGNAIKFGINFFASKILVVLSLLSVIKSIWKRKVLGKISGVLLWLMVIASPFLFILVSIQMQSRTLFTLAYVIWLLTVLLLKERNKVFLSVNIIIVVMLALQILNINGLYYARSTIAQRHDSVLAADIYQRLGSVDPNFDRNQIAFIDVYGTVNFNSIYPYPSTGTIGVSFFEWDNGNLDRMVYYMRLLGYSNIRPLSGEKRAALTPEFAKMSSWPADECVQKIGDTYLIKLSDTPDTLHTKYLTIP